MTMDQGGTDTLGKLPSSIRLSPSSMSLWKQCPKRWFFERVLNLEGGVGFEAVWGSFVHFVLERLMHLPAPERTVEKAKQLATECWDEFISDPSTHFSELGLDEQGLREFKENAWVGILGYFQIEDPSQVTVIGTEVHLSGEFDEAPVHGFIDRLDQGASGWVISDYKAGRVPEWDNERDEKLHQLRTYAAVIDSYGHRVAEIRLLYLSPQVAAQNRLVRLQREEMAAMAALEQVFPRKTVPQIIDMVTGIGTSRSEAVKGLRGEAAKRAGASAVMKMAERLALEADELAEHEDVIATIINVVAARRRTFYAKRSARTATPCTVSIQVTDEDIHRARYEVTSTWKELNDAFASRSFPAKVGVLCGWCPFASFCEEYQASQKMSQ